MNSVKERSTIGIDLGGTNLRVGLYGPRMHCLSRRSMPTRTAQGPDAVVGDMAGAVRAMLDEHRGALEVEGIGIGSPGPLNLRTGSLELLPNFPGWQGYPLRSKLADATGLPVTLDCDANAAALAEWKLGAGRTCGVESMAMITLGTGVGSGIVLNGRIWHGQVGMAGEIGHISVNPDGPPCACGGRGCLELYASAKGLIRLAAEAAASTVCSPELKALVRRANGCTPLEVAELAQRGDKSAQQAFERMGHYVGLGLASLANTLDLPLLVIGGGVAAAWPLFAEAMFSTLRRYSYVYRLREPTQLQSVEEDRTFICPALLGESAGLLGAALLPSFQAAPQSFPTKEIGALGLP